MVRLSLQRPKINFNSSAFQAFYAVSPDNALLQRAGELSAEYMRALMEVFPERNFYPDANSTLRVTYGKLEGVSPRDAVSYGTTTYLDGAMAKYKPGDYEFDMPAPLRYDSLWWRSRAR